MHSMSSLENILSNQIEEIAHALLMGTLGEIGGCERNELFESFARHMDAVLEDELHQGAESKRDEENLKGRREVSHWLDFDDACWVEAAKIARACLQAGVNVPFGDVLVFACATRHGVELLERNRHFAVIRNVLKQ